MEAVLAATTVLWFAGMKGSPVADAVASDTAASAPSFVSWELKTRRSTCMRWCSQLKPGCVSQRATISIKPVLAATTVLWFSGMKDSPVADAVASDAAASAPSFVS
ncbi:hypothetical protein SLEP1_g25190 [Rubroshorea leprosula]|uniref:Secreted protein n=1 Tax=Rubroshorea leprosula TaxID=152421 RepID=A0AAV5JSC5_9ROSI|nr:hypothetical protein SLEP1_g25190 [Rubroshorea leprosula]